MTQLGFERTKPNLRQKSLDSERDMRFMCRTRFFEVVPVGALSPCVVTFPGEANGNSRGEVNSGWLVCRAPSASCLSLPLFFCTHTHTHSSACTDSSRTAFLRLSSPLFPSLGFLLSDGSPPWQVERIRVCRCPGVRRNVGRIRTRFVMESHREVAARNFRLILRLSKFPVSFSPGVETRFRSFVCKPSNRMFKSPSDSSARFS